MQVFHWCAHQLKDLPLFEEKAIRPKHVLYNDFDFDPLSLTFEGGFTSNLSYNECVSDIDLSDEELVPVEAIEHAVVSADQTDGILAEDTTFDHPSFDIGGVADKEYMAKVKNLLEHELDDLPLTARAVAAFEMRQRFNYTTGDTVYDAWLIRNGAERPFLKRETLFGEYPSLRMVALIADLQHSDTESETNRNDVEDSEQETQSDNNTIATVSRKRARRRISSESGDEGSSKVVKTEPPNTWYSVPIEQAIEISSDEEITVKEEEQVEVGEKQIFFIEISDSD